MSGTVVVGIEHRLLNAERFSFLNYPSVICGYILILAVDLVLFLLRVHQ